MLQGFTKDEPHMRKKLSMSQLASKRRALGDILANNLVNNQDASLCELALEFDRRQHWPVGSLFVEFPSPPANL